MSQITFPFAIEHSISEQMKFHLKRERRLLQRLSSLAA